MVVYDQSTRDVTGLAADSFLSILLGKLDSCFHSVSILTGRSPGLPLQLALLPYVRSYGAVAAHVHVHLLPWPPVAVAVEGSPARRPRRLNPSWIVWSSLCVRSLHRLAPHHRTHQPGCSKRRGYVVIATA